MRAGPVAANPASAGPVVCVMPTEESLRSLDVLNTRVMQHPGFKAGKVHTKWLEFEGSDLLKEPT